MLANFVSFLTIYIIIDIFTPFHIFLLNIFSDIIVLIARDGFNFKEGIHSSIMYIFFVIITIFMILVFIEIIQLNFCGLSTMTKKNIEERARHDSMLNDDDDDNEKNDCIIKNNDDETIQLGGYSFELQEVSNTENNNQI